jgi:UDP-N-acetyl-D-mannosaminuronic acid dehydrogenase
MDRAGFRVQGVEIRRDLVERLLDGESRVSEPLLERQLQRARDQKRLDFSTHIEADCRAKVFVIAVGTIAVIRPPQSKGSRQITAFLRVLPA